jgi:hypothetical protein
MEVVEAINEVWMVLELMVHGLPEIMQLAR